MSAKRVRWVIAAVLVLGLLAGAYPIVQARNRAFYPAGQQTAAPFLH
jgi:hypothetical protein